MLLAMGRVLFGAVLALAFVGCGGRAVHEEPQAKDGSTSPEGGSVLPEAGSDGSTKPDANPPDANPPDANPPDATVLPDSGSDPCACPMDGPPEDRPVYQYHECVPPLQFGCNAQQCTPGETDCGEGRSCEVCAAAACCICAACMPACVFTGPAQGPLPEYLKISPIITPAYEDVTLRVQGYPFYVGALYYLVKVGESEDLFQGGGSTCSFDVTVPGQPPQTVPVWVSQYGGNDPWVLAGFLTWSDGTYPSCMQPGYPCGPQQPCCETLDVPMACVAGRCRRP